jgi:hypothetical protein
MAYRRGIGLQAFLLGMLATAGPAFSADLGPGPQPQTLEPIPASTGWTFSFTPYAWLTGVDGSVTVRGHKANINDSFIDIVDKSDSLFALMGYFEARKGRLGLFTDVVWEDLGFGGHYQQSSSPFRRLSNAKVSVKANAQLDYQSTIVQSGFAYELAKWPSGAGTSFTALDLMGSARYWNQEADVSLDVSGALTADFERLGLKVKRSGSRAVAQSGTLQWVDPVVGMRLRHEWSSGSRFELLGDVGGFGAGSEFSWQAVAVYGFDVPVFGTTMHSVVGYRALSVDYSENGAHGQNVVDFIQHGPLLGASFRW